MGWALVMVLCEMESKQCGLNTSTKFSAPHFDVAQCVVKYKFKKYMNQDEQDAKRY